MKLAAMLALAAAATVFEDCGNQWNKTPPTPTPFPSTPSCAAVNFDCVFQIDAPYPGMKPCKTSIVVCAISEENAAMAATMALQDNHSVPSTYTVSNVFCTPVGAPTMPPSSMPQDMPACDFTATDGAGGGPAASCGSGESGAPCSADADCANCICTAQTDGMGGTIDLCL